MAFVYRSSSKENLQNTPGPGQYLKSKHQQIKYSSAPFNNSSNRQIWTQNPNPGPGSYKISGSLAHQNKLIQDQAVQMVIFQTPKPTSQFKSSTLRFQNINKISSPGPGEYSAQIIHESSKPIDTDKNKTSQLKKYLKQSNFNRVRQIQQKQIYIESRQRTPPVQQVRPSTATILAKKSKNSIFFASKVKRQEKVRPQTSIGPGSYNIVSQIKEKNECNTNKVSTKSICIEKYSNLNGANQFINVGPGSYQVQKSFKFIQKPKSNAYKHLQCFGSTVDRFIKNKTNQSIAPGPASYQVFKCSQKINGSKNRPKTTFGTDSKRQFYTAKSNPNLAPGAYQNYNDFQQLLKQKFKNGTIGSFGSTQQRFSIKSAEDLQQPSKVQNLQIIQATSSQDFEKTKCGKFKRLGFKPKFKKHSNNLSNTIVKEMHKFSKIDQRPLCYDAQAFTFSKKFKSKRQLDAPFLTCSQRFNFKEKKPEQSLDQDKIKQEQACVSDRKDNNKNKSFNKPKGCSSMKFTDSRFKYPEQKQVKLGPQYYNAGEYQKCFNKKSFNKLFS